MPDTKRLTTPGTFLVRYLETCGVVRAYCVPGESFLPILDAFVDSTIDLVTCHHEGSAGFMALAEGRATNIPGICLVSRGPGAANAAIALHAAEQDGVPLVLIVGQVPRAALRRGSFQEIDYAQMFAGICKWVIEVSDPQRIAEVMGRAMHVACDGTPGPVVVVLPEDAIEDAIEEPVARPPVRSRLAPCPDAVAEARALMERAARPLIVAGHRLADERGRAALLQAAEALQAPVLVSFRRHDLFPNDHPLFAGELGSANEEEQLEAFSRSDVILAVGTRLGDVTTNGYRFPRSGWAQQTLIHVYDDSTVIGTNFHPDLGIVCAPVDFLRALAPTGERKADQARAQWSRELVGFRDRITRWTPRLADDGIVFGNAISRLGRHLPANAVVVPDAGTSAALVYRYISFTPPQQLFASVAGCMGYGMPAAISVAMAHPDRPVVSIAGDGGFMMSCSELAIAVQRRLPIVFLVANNRSLGSIRIDQERTYPGRKSGTDLSPPDFQLFARAHGCPSILVEREDEVDAALAKAFAHEEGPILVEFKTSLSAILPSGSC